MSLHLANITFDCDDTLAVARFWSAALDRPLDPEPGEKSHRRNWAPVFGGQWGAALAASGSRWRSVHSVLSAEGSWATTAVSEPAVRDG